MTRSEALKLELEKLLPVANYGQIVVSLDNPYNQHCRGNVFCWIIPPEITVDDRKRPVVVSLEVRTTRSDFPEVFIAALEAKFPVFDVVESYLPAGGIGVINKDGYLYKFKIRWTPCLSGL